MASARNLLVWLTVAMCTQTVVGQDIGYVEDFALSDDRAAALKQLIPGTEDFYYYHCLHFQNTEQFGEVEKMLAEWIKRHNYTPRVREIRNRQALLTYAQNPDAALTHLRQQLNLHFNHQRETLGQKPNLPTALDAARIAREAFARDALARHQNLNGFEDSALDWLVATELNPDRRRDLLQRLRRPDYPQLVELVVADLNYKNSGGFGSLPIHGLLLRSQLDECLRLKADLLNQAAFVNAYLVKLQPGADSDWRREADQTQAYLDRLWDFVQTLAPVHNSLKAHVLYHRLVFDRQHGVYDQDRFLAYIQLPRSLAYVEPRLLELEASRRFPADVNADFMGVTLLPPVGNDEPLVRSYLEHLLLDLPGYEAFSPYIADTYLKRLFAETKILYGVGDAQQWSALLEPAVFQALKERVDIDFAYTNAPRFAADAAVGLDVDIKNVATLIVKVYEINSGNFYRQNLREVNTDINLDGLVANWEETYRYGDPPLRRLRRHFDFPQLNRAGVYVVDFIGNGRSSRAVVFKGSLRHIAQTTAAGQVLVVYDEQNRRLPDARLWLGGREFVAGADGEIVVPFSTAPQRQPIVLSQGDFSWLDEFQHESEQYSLRAGIYVDRESLLKQNTARVVIRPQLYLNGIPVTLSLLQDVRLAIASRDRDDVQTTKEVADFKLFEDREAVYEFQVPQRLRAISFQLKARVRSLSENKDVDLSAAETFLLNEIDGTDKIEDLHLLLVDGAYALDVLGKSGEPRSDRPVQLALKHRDFREPMQVTLKTDPRGRVQLGPLAEIAMLTVQGPEGTSHSWQLIQPAHTHYDQRHGLAGEPLVVPYPGPPKPAGAKPGRDEVSLLEMRGETFLADHFDALSIDGGLLQIQGLAPGDYDLWLKQPDRRIRLRIAAGRREADLVLGGHRLLEVRNPAPLQIAAIEPAEETVVIRLQNATKHARVHVFATHFWPAYSAFGQLSAVRDAEPAWLVPRRLETLYVEGRNIGDEYRYIIDRKYAARFPGNMLERPSLLLNPWPIRTTETGTKQAAAGEEFAPEQQAAGPVGGRGADAMERVAAGGDFANLDFLAEASAVLLNLSADEEGLISVPRTQLGAHQHLHVVAVDPLTTAYRQVSLPEPEIPLDDLRLTRGLDPAKHYAQKKQITAVGGHQPFELADITSSRFEFYDDLAKAYTLYSTLSGDAKLAEFSFVARWPQLKPEERREKYSKYACHELNFFLYHKDPEFFRHTVQPLLQNKKDKQFLDRWLLGQDLAEFQQPWSYGRLNIVERILLAQRIAAERQPTERHVRDLFDLLPPDVDRFNRLFDTAVQGSALETGDMLGIDAAKKLAELADREVRLGTIAGRSDLAAAPLAPAAPRSAPSLRPKDATRESAEPAAPPAPSVADELAKESEQLGEKLGRQRRAGDKSERDEDLYFDRRSELRKSVRQLYQKLDKTQEWVENHYYRLPIEEQTAELITANAFWRDYAGHGPGDETAFRSVHFADASRNFPEMMFALAVLDLPFAAEKHATAFDQGAMTLTSGSPLIVFHEEIKPAEPIEEKTPILVSQNFFRLSDRYRHENNERLDKFITDEFLVHVVYGCQIVITNPTSSQQKLDVLLQVPLGAIPVSNGRYTRSVHLGLQPYSTQTLEYHFYFPAPGQFPHYPVHVAKNEQLLASAEPFRFNVVAEATQIDTQSWDYISQYGSPDDVIRYLEANNLHRTNLDKIAFRTQDKAFFDRVIPLLSGRHAYNHTLWSYGLKHNVPTAIQQFLRHADEFVAECGEYLQSPLLTIDPVERKAYQHMEYLPLVNARAHQLGRERQILNDRFHQQYHRLMKILTYRRQLDHDDLLAVTYYLLLQDRVGEALSFYARVNPQQLDTRLQYDYFTAYLAFYQEQPERARALTAQYADYPVDRWREAFAAVAAQIAEIEGQAAAVVDADSRDQVQSQLAATEAAFDFRVEARQVAIDYQNVRRAVVNYYLMDIELLFSRNPFVQQYAGQFSSIRPNQTQTVELPEGAKQHRFPLPEALHNSNVLVEITAAGQTRSQPYYANSLAVQMIENYGQVRVADSGEGKPLAKVYVKVYARMQDGSVRFYKDGYTDLRGRFEYTSLSTNEQDFVERFALLILSQEQGAVVREAAPPKR